MACRYCPSTSWGIGSFSDDCRPQAALVARELGLVTHSPEIVELIRNKHLMRRRLTETGNEATASAIADSAEMLRRFAAEHGYPLRGEAC
jgi:biotin carboxylase